MPELRYNPLLNTYTMVASNRQNRPHFPKDWCPFCPENEKVPNDFEVYAYPNDFAVLNTTPQTPNEHTYFNANLYHVLPAYGVCEVILYSPLHNAKLYELTENHLVKLVNLWISRFQNLSQDNSVQYIFIFENKGEAVGVTMPHPHGQLYAYPFVPLKIKTELDNCKHYFEKHNQCLLCAINEEEKLFEQRIIFENEHFIAYIPYFTDYPYGVFITAKQHAPDLLFFKNNLQAQKNLAQILKYITGAFDQIFDIPFPYMMCMHQAPVNQQNTAYSEASHYYHFHIEFYPPLREKDKIKWYASSEMGAWAAANVVEVEQSVQVLKKALHSFLNKI